MAAAGRPPAWHPPAVSNPRIREMIEADIPGVVDMIQRASWRARASWLEFAVSQPACHPVVAELDGEPIGTGVGTANGAAGWIGTIFVTPERRGHGLGRALTEAVIDRLDAVGCRSLVLVATEEGRRLYERMGFEVEARYHVLEVPGLPPDGPPMPGATAWPGRVEAFGPGDLEAVAALDLEATGEDRRHALARFATPESAKVARSEDGALEGFVVRASWGGGATVARSPAAALAILDARRRTAGPDDIVRLGVLDVNQSGLVALEGAGVTASWSAPRMVRGEPLTWRPEWVWGQFNYAMG